MRVCLATSTGFKKTVIDGTVRSTGLVAGSDAPQACMIIRVSTVLIIMQACDVSLLLPPDKYDVLLISPCTLVKGGGHPIWQDVVQQLLPIVVRPCHQGPGQRGSRIRVSMEIQYIPHGARWFSVRTTTKASITILVPVCLLNRNIS